MESLKEYLTQTDEQGMFFDRTDSPYAWNNLKVPAHVDVMEAFEMVGSNATIVEEMKMWLFKTEANSTVGLSGSYSQCCLCFALPGY